MARTQATNRTQAANRTQATNRSSISAYRIPISFRDLGITNLWDFRTGYAGANGENVKDMIGALDTTFTGSSNLSSVYTANQYYAHTVASNNDIFKTLNKRITGSAITQLTIMQWCKRGNVSAGHCILSQYDSQALERCFLTRLQDDETLQFIVSDNGTDIDTVNTNEAVFSANEWMMVSVVYNAGGCTVYKNTTALTLDSTLSITSLHPAQAQLYLNAFVNSSGFDVSKFDGQIGITAMALGTALTASEIEQFYNATLEIGGYT